MSKVDILRLDSVTTNDTKATALINTNFQNIQNVIETLLSRNGATPNYMDAVLDMNSYRIINTAAPTEDFDVVNLKYLRDYVGNLEELVENARQYANTAILNAQNAAGSANVAATASQTALEARDAAVDAAIEVQGIKEDVEGIAQDIEGMIDDPNLVAVGTDLRDPDGKINTVLDGAEALIEGRYGADLSFSNGELQLLDQNGSGLGSSVEIDVLPAQAGNAGKYLTTDGTDTSWGAITAEGLLTQAQRDAINSGVTSATVQSVEGIEDLIPSQASAQNQLADKEFVNSSIATNTANFIGTFNSVADLEAYTGTVTPNDYAFVIDTDNQGNTIYNRYKYNGTSWIYEYTLNNSSFTAAQWAAINSGITSTDVATIATKQDILVSGTNIKSINGSSLLGSGNLTIDSLPAQAGNSGKFLTTNGTSASWTANPDTNPYKGVYDASVTYNRGDYVRYASGNTRYWVCDMDGTVGQTPSEGTYWHAFSDTYHLKSDLVTDNANYQLLLIADTNSLQFTGKGKYSPNAPKVNANTGEIIGYAKTTDLPTVNNSQITFTQGGVTKGAITLNQSSDATIALDAGGGSGSVDIDNSTITTNANDEIQAEGTLNHNTATGATNPIYDWVGTTAEYEAQNVATTHPEWLCFITDDTTPDVSTLANKDLSNLTSTGKSTAAELSMPSNTYIDETYTSSYTAPANGYLYVSGSATSNGGIITLTNTSASFSVQSSGAHSVGYGENCTIPCKKGDIISVYVATVNINAFRFIYAEGEI